MGHRMTPGCGCPTYQPSRVTRPDVKRWKKRQTAFGCNMSFFPRINLRFWIAAILWTFLVIIWNRWWLFWATQRPWASNFPGLKAQSDLRPVKLLEVFKSAQTFMEFPRIGWYCTSLFPNAITELDGIAPRFFQTQSHNWALCISTSVGHRFWVNSPPARLSLKGKSRGTSRSKFGDFWVPRVFQIWWLDGTGPWHLFPREQKNWHLDTLCWSLGEWAMWDKPWHSTRTHDWMRVANKNAILTRVKWSSEIYLMKDP